jgi:hypothetical protein
MGRDIGEMGRLLFGCCAVVVAAFGEESVARKMEEGSGIGCGMELLRVESAVAYADGGERDLLPDFSLRMCSAIAFAKSSSLMGSGEVGSLNRPS